MNAQPQPEEALDPVCGMTISPADAVGTVVHRGETYYFCAESCLEQFKEDPERYVQGAGKFTTRLGAVAIASTWQSLIRMPPDPICSASSATARAITAPRMLETAIGCAN